VNEFVHSECILYCSYMSFLRTMVLHGSGKTLFEENRVTELINIVFFCY
jgi:hypothetical protein